MSLWNFNKECVINTINHTLFDAFHLTRDNIRKDDWKGTFGCMCALSKQYVNELNEQYNFFTNALSVVNTRDHRMTLERLMGILYHKKTGRREKSIFGNIVVWCSFNTFGGWGLTWETYQENFAEMGKTLIVKVWTGR